MSAPRIAELQCPDGQGGLLYFCLEHGYAQPGKRSVPELLEFLRRRRVVQAAHSKAMREIDADMTAFLFNDKAAEKPA